MSKDSPDQGKIGKDPLLPHFFVGEVKRQGIHHRAVLLRVQHFHRHPDGTAVWISVPQNLGRLGASGNVGAPAAVLDVEDAVDVHILGSVIRQQLFHQIVGKEALEVTVLSMPG